LGLLVRSNAASRTITGPENVGITDVII
jgi:hypothetical protein